MSAFPETIVKPALLKQFQVAAGSVPGRRHMGTGNLIGGSNNQDAYSLTFFEDAIIATVFDGCGSAANSEVGAKLAVNLVPAVIEAQRAQGKPVYSQDFWDDVTEELLRRILAIAHTTVPNRTIALQTNDTPNSAVDDLHIDPTSSMGQFLRSHFLFTVMGAVITDSVTVIFSCGDGVFQLNRELTSIGPFEDNAPPYLAYGLLAKTGIKISIQNIVPTETVDELLLGTDGLLDLVSVENRRIPGKTRTVGSINKLWVFDPVFENIDSVIATPQLANSLTGWLRQLNSEVVRLIEDEGCESHLVREPGLLPDDTTLVALRRTAREVQDG